MRLPDGFARVAPYVFAADALAYMEHIIVALGGVEVNRTMRGDGKLANGIVRFGDASIMISEAGQGFPPSHCALYFYVEDANAAMAQAVSGGMLEIMPVSDMPYGDRQGGVRDRAGNIWWISERLTDEPYSN